MKNRSLVLLSFLLILGLMSCQSVPLKNEYLKAASDRSGKLKLEDASWKVPLNIDSVGFAITVNGQEFLSEKLGITETVKSDSATTTKYQAGGFTITLRDELKPGWHFLSRQIFVESAGKDVFKVNKVVLFSGKLVNPVQEAYQITGGKYGLSFRLKDEAAGKPAVGCFMLIQNPFAKYESGGQSFRLSYDPEMKWNPANGPFPTDRMCLGTFRLTGNTFRQDMAAEWVYEPDPEAYLAGGSQIDYAEMKAVTDCARRFLIGQPQKGVRVHVGWCENDYQIDMAKPENRVEYKRMIDQAAATGCNYILYTPDHSGLSSLKDNTDAWGWESLLFLNMGQKIRKGEWYPGKNPLPADIQEIIDYAAARHVKLLAYAYPSLPWMQNPEWTDWRTKIGQKPEGYLTVDTGLRSFQDWWVNLLIDFYKSTGIGGYSFDHWWMNYTDEAGLVSSKYQQWFGTRRILEELRRRAPEMIVDGRQQYHGFGTWTWLAGTYPHPLMTDEQPGSFNSYPDLSTDRVTAGRQRWVAWRLMTRDFTPVEIRPGFITHQTQREDAARVMRRDKYRTRDWDYLGWKFNLMSVIGTAPFNLVVNYLPARDEQEFKAFSEADKQFLKKWMDFTDQNAAYLKNLMPITGQPMIGHCDGTSAILDNRGYLFLFNPNYRRLNVHFKIDESIGLEKPGKYLLTEIFPVEGLHPGQAGTGFYEFGSRADLPMDGVTARVFRIDPVEPGSKEPVLFNCAGKVSLDGDAVRIENASGLQGETLNLMVALPEGFKPGKLSVNGKEIAFSGSNGMLSADVTFTGTDFRQAQQFGKYDPAFSGEVYETEFLIPERIKNQLNNRKKLWPVSYTPDDLLAPWVDPSRLLLYVQIAEPFWTTGTGKDMKKVPIRATELSMELDGKPVQLKEAYNGVYPFVERTNLGFYLDISGLAPDVQHKIRLKLPKGLKPGQFQGIFADHVENQFTNLLGK